MYVSCINKVFVGIDLQKKYLPTSKILDIPNILLFLIVTFQVDNWADNDALRQPNQSYIQRPSYRRSFSELPTPQNLTPTNINRRSLGSEATLQTTFPKTSTSMSDIQSSQKPIVDHFGAMNRSCSSNVSAGTEAGATSNNLYTYIGITEPDRDKQGHVYENQCVVNKAKSGFDHKRHEAM